MIFFPQSKMDRSGQHSCFTLSILSIVICPFVRHKIPLQKAQVICKIINVQNDAKLSDTNVRTIKSTVGYSEWSSILTASEKQPPYKIFDYSCQDLFCMASHPIKKFMDNPPTHNKKEKHTSPCLFSHNKGMNTMICVLQPFSPFSLAQPGHKFTPRCVSPLKCFILSYFSYFSYYLIMLSYLHGSHLHLYVVQIGANTQANARVALLCALVLMCNGIQNWFMKITAF